MIFKAIKRWLSFSRLRVDRIQVRAIKGTSRHLKVDSQDVAYAVIEMGVMMLISVRKNNHSELVKKVQEHVTGDELTQQVSIALEKFWNESQKIE